jgi:hypothetical protein
MGAPARAYNHHIASWAIDQGCKQPLIQFVAESAIMLVSAALRVKCQSGDSCAGDWKRIIHSMYAPLGETLTLRTVFFLNRRGGGGRVSFSVRIATQLRTRHVGSAQQTYQTVEQHRIRVLQPGEDVL